MKWTIIIFVMMSLLGSMMWVMPSPRQRLLAKLRQQASRDGFQVQIVRLTPPRAAGQVEPETFTATAYRLPRFNLEKEQRHQFIPWQIFRQVAVANQGLPEGWCWGLGERRLNEQQLATLNTLLAGLPEGVSSIESTPIHISLYWDERGDENTLDELKARLQPFIEQRF
ncbi:hypothetical protein Q4488_08775 [Amphritea sp. 1_MG-2023]|uniref:hypothetical protein n=1 Tax=Amphritea sp. 1_MG-2023 TaxID=3062670 RepID=UPI0026E2C1D5|nr:hypothetical protein [Amphritea sp. 1_MG-2023]MDO6563473.1 hypothetical protein [Amphritea sp. 1_MG-2023]